MRRHLGVLAAAFVLLSGASILVRAQGQGASSITIDQILNAIGVTEGSTVCEVGAGVGDMALVAAKRVGATGRVYANELRQLDPLKVKVADSGLTNITVVAGEARGTNFPDAACDALYLHNVYHHFTDPSWINRAIFAAVKPGARVAVVDFRPPDKEAEKPEDRGNDGTHGVTPATVIREMKAAGFDEAPGAASAGPASNSRWFLSVFVRPVKGIGSAASTCLIVDFDNDGLKLTTPEEGVLFDINGDGVAERVGWPAAGAQDGFLAIDVNGNGHIDSGAELIGNVFQHPVVTRPSSGITVIALLQGATISPDSRVPPTFSGASPMLEPDDENFKLVKVWIDVNHDGKSEAGELRALPDTPIRAVGPGAQIINRDQRGHVLRYDSYVLLTTRDDVRRMYEVVLAREPVK